MQISETVKRFITNKVTEIYKTKFKAVTFKEIMGKIEQAQDILAEEAEGMILEYLTSEYPDIAEYIKANRLYIKFDADIYYNYNGVALDEAINAEAQEMQAEIEKKVDEIITTLELNGGNMETLTQLLHKAAMSL